MRHHIFIFAFILACIASSSHAQVAGKLYIAYTQNVTTTADSIGYYQYPSGDFTTVADYSARDFEKIGDLIFCAPTTGLGGRYDTLKHIDVFTDQNLGLVPGNFTTGNVEEWNNQLVIRCGEAPYLRVLNPVAPFSESWNLVGNTDLPKAPFGMTVYGGNAYLWTDSLIKVVNLSAKQITHTIPFPAGYQVQSEFNAVLGAADSAYLTVTTGRNASFRDTVAIYKINLSQNSLEYRDEYVVTGLLAFPGVGAGDVIHFSRYRAYYDARTGTVIPDVPGQTFLPGQASSYDDISETLVVMEEASFNRQFLWLESGDTIINTLRPLILPTRTVLVWSTIFVDNITLSIEKPYSIAWQLFPNPAQDIMFIESPEVTTFSIYDLQGKTLLEGDLLIGETEVKIGGLPAGTYMCRLQGGGSKLFVKY